MNNKFGFFPVPVGFLIALFLPLASATAEASEDPRACVDIASPNERLSCYDRVFSNRTAASIPAQSKWKISEEKSMFDDTPKIIASLEAESVEYSGMGRGRADLVLRCIENNTSVIVATNMFMKETSVSVTTRVGDRNANTSKWGRSTNYKAVGLWRGSESISFIESLSDGARLAVRIEEEDTVVAEFVLAGVSGVITKIRDSCNW